MSEREWVVQSICTIDVSEYLSDLNKLLQEDEMAEVSFTEMEFSEKRTFVLRCVKSIVYDSDQSTLSVQYVEENRK